MHDRKKQYEKLFRQYEKILRSSLFYYSDGHYKWKYSQIMYPFSTKKVIQILKPNIRKRNLIYKKWYLRILLKSEYYRRMREEEYDLPDGYIFYKRKDKNE